MKNLNVLFEQAMYIVESCGIETGDIANVTINTRAKTRWGQCRKMGGRYYINISSRILADEVDTHATMETIIHEILHTCYGCMNHGKNWKRLANIITRETGLQITTTSSAERFGLEEEVRNNYIFVCEKCGQVIRRNRKSKFVKNYRLYRCGKCGGELRFDKENSKCSL